MAIRRSHHAGLGLCHHHDSIQLMSLYLESLIARIPIDRIYALLESRGVPCSIHAARQEMEKMLHHIVMEGIVQEWELTMHPNDAITRKE